MQLNVQSDKARLKRTNRRPNFPQGGVMKPYGLYPMMIHPVLPGETMQSFTSRLKVVSQPLKNPLTGGWFESWLVYVKLTDIDRDLGQQFMNEGESQSGYTAAADNPRFFTSDGQTDWVKLCYDRIVDDYFTDEGETIPTIDGVAKLKLNNRSWYNNLMFEPADTAVDVTDARQTYEALTGWAMLQQMQMTELTYEDYLETYGVKPANALNARTEILRFYRKWSSPTNTVDPATGKPSATLYYSEEMKMDGKPKRFVEPGFVMQLGALRPKMYQASLKASLCGELWGFNDWYPSYLLDDPTAGVKQLDGTAKARVFDSTAVPSVSKAAIYDHRDLLSHGEQFINAPNTELPYDLPYAQGPQLTENAPTGVTQGKYPTDAEIDALFLSNENNADVFAYEGMASAVVTGHVKDTIV